MTIKVVVVEDSSTVRDALIGVLRRSGEFDVAASTPSGVEAVELCARHRPDVVTMDMVLNDMSGLEATRAIMQSCPVPIVIVSSSTNRRDLFRTYDALADGALDVYEKPPGSITPAWEVGLLRVLRVCARVAVVTRRPRVRQPVRPRPTVRPQVVAMGASTGGPVALSIILGLLPKEYRPAILVVNHISPAFGTGLPEWLGTQTELDVSFARDGAELPTHGVWLAPPGTHLVVDAGKTHLRDGPELHSCRPSVDVLFHSLTHIGSRAVGVLLTGMGRDGAAGLRAMRDAGAVTFVQDAASSVVWGMPRRALEQRAVDRAHSLHEIAECLLGLGGAR